MGKDEEDRDERRSFAPHCAARPSPGGRHGGKEGGGKAYRGEGGEDERRARYHLSGAGRRVTRGARGTSPLGRKGGGGGEGRGKGGARYPPSPGGGACQHRKRGQERRKETRRVPLRRRWPAGWPPLARRTPPAACRTGSRPRALPMSPPPRCSCRPRRGGDPAIAGPRSSLTGAPSRTSGSTDRAASSRSAWGSWQRSGTASGGGARGSKEGQDRREGQKGGPWQ